MFVFQCLHLLRHTTHKGAFVVPGGHWEHPEEIVDAGLREVEEETGLKLTRDDCRIIAAYESVYKVGHYFIFYVLAHVREDNVELSDPSRSNALFHLAR
jgi:8-oxo-dGTP pyrophosphatase MutT (NUDIX family)